MLRRGAAGPGLGRAVTASPHPFDRQRPGGSGRSNSPIRPGEIKPSKPVRTVKYNHLPIVDRRHVGAGPVVSSVKRRGLAVGLRRVRFHSVGGRDGNQAGPPPWYASYIRLAE